MKHCWKHLSFFTIKHSKTNNQKNSRTLWVWVDVFSIIYTLKEHYEHTCEGKYDMIFSGIFLAPHNLYINPMSVLIRLCIQHNNQIDYI